MQDIASDIIRPYYYFHWDSNSDQPLNRHPNSPTPCVLPLFEAVRACPPQLSDTNPGHGGGSRGLQEPADGGRRSDIPNSRSRAEQHKLPFSTEDLRRVFERLRHHESRTPYPANLTHDMRHTEMSRANPQESSQASGMHSPSSIKVNFTTRSTSNTTPSVAIATTTNTTGRHSPVDLLAGINTSDRFPSRPPSPRFLWLAPVRLHEIAYSVHYMPELMLIDEDDEAERPNSSQVAFL